MPIGRRISGPDVHSAAQEQVEVRPELGSVGLDWPDINEEDIRNGTTDDLIATSRAAKDMVDILEAVRKKVGEEIMSRMCQDGETEHATSDGQWVCQLLVGRTGAKLSETRLLERGVSADVIAESREPAMNYTYVQIKAVKR